MKNVETPWDFTNTGREVTKDCCTSCSKSSVYTKWFDGTLRIAQLPRRGRFVWGSVVPPRCWLGFCWKNKKNIQRKLQKPGFGMVSSCFAVSLACFLMFWFVAGPLCFRRVAGWFGTGLWEFGLPSCLWGHQKCGQVGWMKTMIDP
jgi:hypothetical protein